MDFWEIYKLISTSHLISLVGCCGGTGCSGLEAVLLPDCQSGLSRLGVHGADFPDRDDLYPQQRRF